MVSLQTSLCSLFEEQTMWICVYFHPVSCLDTFPACNMQSLSSSLYGNDFVLMAIQYHYNVIKIFTRNVVHKWDRFVTFLPAQWPDGENERESVMTMQTETELEPLTPLIHWLSMCTACMWNRKCRQTGRCFCFPKLIWFMVKKTKLAEGRGKNPLIHSRGTWT